MLVCAPLDNVEGSVAWKPRQASHQVSATTTAYTTPEDRPKAIPGQRAGKANHPEKNGPWLNSQQKGQHFTGQSSPSKYGRGEQMSENNLSIVSIEDGKVLRTTSS